MAVVGPSVTLDCDTERLDRALRTLGRAWCWRPWFGRLLMRPLLRWGKLRIRADGKVIATMRIRAEYKEENGTATLSLYISDDGERVIAGRSSNT